MRQTPSSNRKHIVLAGETNAGKSSLFNALLGQPHAIVSDIPGTTTDPVTKAAELIPFGPVTLVDTAGLSDTSALGAAREQKTGRWLEWADLVLYVIDPSAYDPERYMQMTTLFEERRLPYITVLMKKDLFKDADAMVLPESAETLCRVSIYDEASLDALREAIIRALQTQTKAEASLIGGLLAPGSVVVMVATADSEAPAGRLILPQTQLIRDCLDHQIRCHVVNEHGLEDAFKELARVDLVVTDSQIFSQVEALTPRDCPLTSFSILMARQKGDFRALYEGVLSLRDLKPGDRVLMAEACTHNRSHEDIGRVKLPRLLERMVGGPLDFDFRSGRDFPDDVSGYDLIVHCGGCMLTPSMLAARQARAAAQGVPMTNYGMVLASGSGILERCVEMMVKW